MKMKIIQLVDKQLVGLSFYVCLKLERRFNYSYRNI